MIAIVIIVVAPLGLEVGLTLAERCVCVFVVVGAQARVETCSDSHRLTLLPMLATAGIGLDLLGFAATGLYFVSWLFLTSMRRRAEEKEREEQEKEVQEKEEQEE